MAKVFSNLSVGSTIYLRNYQNYEIKKGLYQGHTIKIRCSTQANYHNQDDWIKTATVTYIEEYGNELYISYKTHNMNHTVRVCKNSTSGRFAKHSGLQQFEYYVLTELD